MIAEMEPRQQSTASDASEKRSRAIFDLSEEVRAALSRRAQRWGLERGERLSDTAALEEILREELAVELRELREIWERTGADAPSAAGRKPAKRKPNRKPPD